MNVDRVREFLVFNKTKKKRSSGKYPAERLDDRENWKIAKYIIEFNAMYRGFVFLFPIKSCVLHFSKLS